MSEQSISDKSQQIRNETAKYANSKVRVADVLDDINETKANKDDLSGIETISSESTFVTIDNSDAKNPKLETHLQDAEGNPLFNFDVVAKEDGTLGTKTRIERPVHDESFEDLSSYHGDIITVKNSPYTWYIDINKGDEYTVYVESSRAFSPRTDNKFIFIEKGLPKVETTNAITLKTGSIYKVFHYNPFDEKIIGILEL
ncbi:hypothetical protein [Elizabethkingia ursingii]|uniref:hypothetical protein n=1 Tax=Elizabethkingia ursingii TaxID=1756150 RepID=UPI000751884E|nr:hypothetical protein [Elizabethkingia ursingii]KUY29389.1 hypothetical protein ATB96_18915 [Elizabethkingia ursingii]